MSGLPFRVTGLVDSELTPVQLEATEEGLAQLFSEWDRRYRENPERFWTDVEHLLGETPESYGAACAAYLLLLARESDAS